MTTSVSRDTTAQLKADIDAGRTGDKVAWGDPGLSPLGTDDEAGGNPASADAIRDDRRHQQAIGAGLQADMTSSRPQRAWFIPALLTLLLLILAGAAVVGMWTQTH